MPNEVVAGLMLSIDGNTVKLRTEFDKAKASSRAATQQMKADMMEARGAIKLAGEEIGVNLNRHLTSFLAKLPGVAPIMAAAFSATAIVGLGMAFAEAGKKLYEFFSKAKESAEKAKREVDDFVGGLHKSNLEREVQLAKMDEEIAKLEHRPGNALKTALAEARLEAFSLGEELRKAVDQEQKLMENELASTLMDQMLKNSAGGSGDVRQLKEYQDGLTKIASITDPGERTSKLKAYTGVQLDALHEEIAARTTLQQLRNRAIGPTLGAHSGELSSDEASTYRGLIKRFGGTLRNNEDQTKELARLASFHDMVQEQYQASADTAEQIQKQAKLDKLKEPRSADSMAYFRRRSEDLREYTERIKANTAAIEENIAKDFDDDQRSKAGASKQEGETQRRSAEDYYKDLERRGQQAAELQQNQRAAASGGYNSQVESSKIAVELGRMSEGQRLSALKAALDTEHSLKTESFNQELDIYNEGTRDYLRVLGERAKADAEYFHQRAELEKESIQQGMMAPLLDLSKQWTNWQSTFKQSLDSTLSGINGELVRMMTTQYRRGDWKNASKPVFSGLAMSGLQGAEGSLMKLIPGMGKLGTRSNPMITQDINGLGAAGGAASGAASAVGSAVSGAGAGGVSGFLSILGGVAKFAGFMADGGTMSPGGFYLTGERGPELVSVGSTSRIHNARDTSKMMGGGGETHHHWNIDARGATDPAAVKRAARDAVAEAAPHIAAATMAAQRDLDSRRPTFRG